MNLLRLSNAREKMDSVSSQNWMEGGVDFQDSTGTTKDTEKWGCL